MVVGSIVSGDFTFNPLETEVWIGDESKGHSVQMAWYKSLLLLFFPAAPTRQPDIPIFNCTKNECDDSSNELIVTCDTTGGPLVKTYCSYDGNPLQVCKYTSVINKCTHNKINMQQMRKWNPTINTRKSLSYERDPTTFLLAKDHLPERKESFYAKIHWWLF